MPIAASDKSSAYLLLEQDDAELGQGLIHAGTW
jgi:hypothetical protein